MTTAPSAGAARKTAASPTAAKKAAGAAPSMDKAAPAASTPGSQLQQHLSTLADSDVLTPQGLHDFLEALRSLSLAVSFFTEAAGTQLDLAMRRGARDSVDGRLTMQQKIEMRNVLRRTRRGMGNARDDLLATARDAVLAYSHMEGFLENLKSDSTQRPHRSGRGGFDPFAGGN